MSVFQISALLISNASSHTLFLSSLIFFCCSSTLLVKIFDETPSLFLTVLYLLDLSLTWFAAHCKPVEAFFAPNENAALLSALESSSFLFLSGQKSHHDGISQ
jgi:hypothetical protein